MKNNSKELNDLILKHRKLIERKNKVDENWYNGIYEIYVNPILTNEHIPLEWRYDLNEETNPYLMERIGVNAVFNSGAIYLDGNMCLLFELKDMTENHILPLQEVKTELKILYLMSIR